MRPLLLPLLVLTLSSLTSAEDLPENKSYHLKLARELSEVLAGPQAKQQLQNAMDASTSTMAKKLNLDPDEEKELSEIILQFTEDNYRVFMQGFVDAYAETFTTEELKGLKEFYDSTAGRALLEKTGELNVRLKRNTADWAQEAGDSMLEFVRQTAPHLLRNAKSE